MKFKYPFISITFYLSFLPLICDLVVISFMHNTSLRYILEFAFIILLL
jgi:hypothetical protein